MGVTSIPAYAQSNVQLTGYVYGGIASNSGGATAHTAVGGPASLMIKSKEDLGGGNSILMKWESGFSTTTGALENASSYWDKQAYLGVQGKWGTIRLGRLYTPSFATLALVADPTETYGLFTSTNLMEVYNVRMNYGFIYNTPGFDPWTYGRKGFFGAFAHYMGDPSSGGGMSRNTTTGFNFGYGGGGLVVEFSGNFNNAYTSDTNNIDSTGYILAANYKIGKAKIYLAYADNRATNKFSHQKTKNNTDMLIGFSYAIGKGSLSGSFIKKNDKMPANNDAYQIGIGYDYFFSKRTKLTLAFAKIHNKNPSLPYRIINGYAGTSSASNAGTQTIALGLSHYF